MKQQTAYDIDEVAARYVAEMDGEQWTSAQEDGLQRWLARDPRHPGALLRAQAAWMALDIPRPSANVQTEQEKPALWLNRRTVLAGGSTAIAASIAGGIMLLGGTGYSTSVGEIRRVPLADGSIVVINTASAIDVKLRDAARNISIERGEAWFQVAKDQQRPFIVAAGRARIRAVGTAFSVRRHSSKTEVMVTEGIVEIWANGAEGQRIQLKAGSRGFIADDAAMQQVPVAPSAIDRTLAWRNGKIDLSGARLDAAAAEFNRYNQRIVVIADPAIAVEQLDGVFRTDDPEGFAQSVHVTLGVPVDLSNSAQIRIGEPGQ
ncbi:FecR domain-containing protein [Parasphingorhabdus sp. JC815]|uniref:FecR family protein n=1 Tax=Parasphingorhabdus sp. JC815 TaxID=3232140 RepID=UPI00345B28E0